jgi:aryl-alcohol dehydrogenase-like predicted oxidoreductase
MEQRSLGRTGLRVSLLGFGGAEIGFGGTDQATVDRLLGAALDAGLNTIDTAECYVDSEEKIGKAVAKRREEFHLFTKCGHASGLPGEDWDPTMLAASIDRSLQRLQVDHVDLVQLHSCDETTLRQGDVIDVLQRAREAGKTRFVGYSGDNEAATYAVSTGAFDTLQTSINVADQRGVDAWIHDAHARGMGVIAKRPIANAAWLHDLPEDAYGRPYADRLKLLDYPWLKRADSIATALGFTASVPGVSTMIVGTTNPSRWRENAALLATAALDADTYAATRDRWNEVAGPDWTAQT